MAREGSDLKPWLDLIRVFDITEIFKTKGNLRRWSAKRSVGGAVVLEGLWQIHTFGISWQGIALVGLGLLPLCLSFFGKE